MTRILRLSLPMTIWLIGFSTLYALQGLSCSRHWPPDLEPRATLIAAASALIAVQALVLWLVIRQPSASGFVQRVASALAAVALASALWTSAPVLALGICG